MNVRLRAATEYDWPAISDVMLAAFGEAEGPEIVELVADLLEDPTARPLWSLVATEAERVVGHILFTATRIEPDPGNLASAILAPMAVHPDCQQRGIGRRLINDGLERLTAAGVGLVFVLGDPAFYTRFGFAPAGEQGLEAPHPVPPEHADAWMVQALQPGVGGQVSGRVVCADSLMDPKYWLE